jgi:hypothetical protein
MEKNDFNTYLTIMSVLHKSNIKSYYARTKSERSIFIGLLKEGYVNRLANKKYCYELSSKGIEESSSILKMYQTISMNFKPEKIENFQKIIMKSVLKLMTPIRPMVRIPDLWNYLKNNIDDNFRRELFDNVILEMHKKGKITLQYGFSINETEGGIKTLQGNSYYYIMIDN